MRSIRRVLIVQPYGIGDLLFITPVFRALRLLPGLERVDLLLGSRTEDVVKGNPHIDEVMLIDKDRFRAQGKLKTFQEVLSLGKKLKKRRYDLLLDYSIRGEYGFYSKFFLGIPKRAGFLYKRRGLFHNLRLPIPDGFAGRHAADYACDLAEKAGVKVKDRWLEFYLREEERVDTDRLLRTLIPAKWENRFLVISPGGGESWGKDAHFKRWAPVSFAEFADILAGKLGLLGAVIIGSSKEKDLCESVLKSLHLPALNLAGLLSLRESVRVIEKARLFAGNDGGLLHVACARKTPAIGFYGPVDPLVYGPYPQNAVAAAIYKKELECRPCYKSFRYKADCAHRNCLTALTPPEAMCFVETHPSWNSLKREVLSAASIPQSPHSLP